jgi:hypothetical protein
LLWCWEGTRKNLFSTLHILWLLDKRRKDEGLAFHCHFIVFVVPFPIQIIPHFCTLTKAQKQMAEWHFWVSSVVFRKQVYKAITYYLYPRDAEKTQKWWRGEAKATAGSIYIFCQIRPPSSSPHLRHSGQFSFWV